MQNIQSLSVYLNYQNKKNDFFVRHIRLKPTSQNSSINAIKDIRKLFNELRSNLSREETNRIRKKLYKKEYIYNFLKKKEQEGSLTNIQRRVLRNIERYL